MEVFFLIFQKFFRRPPRPADRRGEQAEKRPDSVRQPEENRQDHPAEGEKIGPAPKGHGGDVVDAHLAVVPQQGQGEQRPRGPQPEQKVQQKGQRPQLQVPAQGAHPVVDKAQQQAQQKALPRCGGLAQNIDVHGSAQQPGQEASPAPAGVVLVGHGVDVALHL